MQINEYRGALADLVQPEAFRGNRHVLVHVVGHFALVVGIVAWLATHLVTTPWWAWGVLVLVAGHSIACTGFAAHEIGHGAIVEGPVANYCWETFAWLLSLSICTSIHGKAHLLHHVFLNSVQDPNSRPTAAEARDYLGELSEWLFPNGKHPVSSALVWLPLVNLHYQMAMLFHTLFQSGNPRFDLRLPRRKAWLAVFETFGLNLGLYLGLWAMGGFDWRLGAFLVVANSIGITIGLAYICTNHMLNPELGDHLDPLELTLTVRVPRWIDFFHLNFSHHNEHHLYPEAGPANYPLIREALLARFPERYHEMGFIEAYREILRAPIATADRDTLVDVKGGGARQVAFPSFSDTGASRNHALAASGRLGPGNQL
ncbi:MAG: fatty acid desaturase [Candidatus Sericytochromatia bacterium]|nr:fatty acid desaturase [Candidatus Sericytochromatia bacterium]